MTNFKSFKAILWDFDGVIMDSMPIRQKGFELALDTYPKDQVAQLLAFHHANGGLSRYVKFRYFFEVIRKEKCTQQMIDQLCDDFTRLMRKELVNPSLLINDSLDFIRKYYNEIPMHIVSGSDGNELRHLCQSMALTTYFRSIDGSPTPKKVLVADVLQRCGYRSEDVVLVGDSINDLEAAHANGVRFLGYNNEALKSLGDGYVEAFRTTSFMKGEAA